jgi:4-carboxymuconolactone decarboxylase
MSRIPLTTTEQQPEPISARMRELIILRVAHLQGSPHELSQHLGLGRSAGLTDAQINAIVDAADPDVAGSR